MPLVSASPSPALTSLRPASRTWTKEGEFGTSSIMEQQTMVLAVVDSNVLTSHSVSATL